VAAAAQGVRGCTYPAPKPSLLDIGLRRLKPHLKPLVPRDTSIHIVPGRSGKIFAMGVDLQVANRGHILPVSAREVEGWPCVTVIGAWPAALGLSQGCMCPSDSRARVHTCVTRAPAGMGGDRVS
jgi:hypothetical protein